MKKQKNSKTLNGQKKIIQLESQLYKQRAEIQGIKNNPVWRYYELISRWHSRLLNNNLTKMFIIFFASTIRLVAFLSNIFTKKSNISRELYLLARKIDFRISKYERTEIVKSGLFNTKWYLDSYPDVAIAGMDPIKHYLLFGWKELRNPSDQFSTKLYLENNSDVLNSSTNPLEHFIYYGLTEGRQIHQIPPPNAPLNKKSGDEKLTTNETLDSFNVTINPFQRYAFVNHFPFRKLESTNKEINLNSLNIHWIIPDFSAGSGGHNNIFRTSNYFESKGHLVTFWLLRFDKPPLMRSPEREKKISELYQPNLKAKVHFIGNNPQKFMKITGDVVVATDWQSVYPAVSLQNFKARFYYIQDFEPSFFPISSGYFLAENTYKMGLDCLCAGDWLFDIMTNRYGSWARKWPLAVNKDIYFPQPNITREKASIVFYARRNTGRRLVEMGFLAFEELFRRGVNFKAIFFGEKNVNYDVKYPYENLGIVTHQQLADIYRKATLGLSFSGTNYSIVPNEMMACGLPVIEFQGENTKKAFTNDQVVFSEPHPKIIADKIELLLSSKEIQDSQRKRGFDSVKNLSWEKSNHIIEKAIKDRLHEIISTESAPNNS